MRTFLQRLFRSACVLALFLGASVQALETALPLGEIDAEIARMMGDWDQPGLALAIVTDVGVVHEKGFGVRSVATKQPVDAQTLFGIASVSKSFASATVAELVAAGKLDWDDPVIKHLPWFRMPRERDTAEVTLRDLLSMRSGFGSSEYTFRRASANRADHVRRIQYLEQLHPLRSEYLYTTDSYTAIGEVVATITKQPWETFAANTLWRPLKMTRTNADHKAARSDANAASPHLTVQGKKQPIDWLYEDYNALPAGGINSTAHDLALWLQFQLNNGQVDGKPLVPATALYETRSPQTPVRGQFARSAWVEIAGNGDDAIGHVSYAMGWQVQTYRGQDVIWHSGGIDGFRSLIGFLPRKNVGFVVLTNADQSLLTMAAFQTLVDFAVARGTQGDWSRRFLEVATADREALNVRAASRASARLKGTKPSLPLAGYSGSFADNGAFGEVRVHVEKDHLVIDAGRLQYDLSHWHNDTFLARPRWPYEMESRNFFVSFQVDPRARANEFSFSTGSDFKRLVKTAP